MKNRLKELRQRYQWSQSELARQLGVTRQAVNGFESGKFDPSLDMAFKIAHVFDVPIENIFIHEAKNSIEEVFYLTPQPMPEAITNSDHLDRLTVKELKEMAKKRQIKGYSKMKKQELIELLSA
ncbi:MAG: helix-turn-helix domain-containing protein [Cyanobacteriota bacterium]|nr:helix-turn-helix domain-containing protein [Cyanobacteriota bacterium]